MTAGFLMAIIVAVLTIVIGVPEYAKPATGSGAAVLPASPGPSPGAVAAVSEGEVPTTKLPTKLKGYRWPVRGGIVAKYYDWDRSGIFSIDGRRVYGAIDITWFPGAMVKAAHRGTVVAVGRDWVDHAGFEDSARALYRGAGKKGFPSGIVIDDGNGYYSVYSNLKDFTVKKGAKVKAGMVIGQMDTHRGRHYVRYELVRMDGFWMRVVPSARKAGYPDYARERVDPLVVFNLEAGKKPRLDKKPPPVDPPRLSDY